MNTLKISYLAKKDLTDIKEYITVELCNPTAALNITAKITMRLRELIEFPKIGASLSAVVPFQTHYRFLVCGHYLMFYRHEETSIFVDRILYSKRDYINILFGDLSDSTEDGL